MQQPSRGPMLLERVVAVARARHLARSTERAYVRWIRSFVAFHHRRHPRGMGVVEVNAFLTSLAVERRVSASTQNQALSAILFLYGMVLEQPLGRLDGVIRARRSSRLPVVLTPEEVGLVLERLDGVPLMVALLLYGAGMRLMEVLRLRVKDVDFVRNEIVVREGKGGKDRVTVLPQRVRGMLRGHLDRCRRHHAREAAGDGGCVRVPHALERK